MEVGEPLDGQNLVTVLTPNPDSVLALEDLSDGEAQFTAYVSISVDGEFGVIGWGSNEYPEVAHVQVLRREGSQWVLLNEFHASRSAPLKITDTHIIHASLQTRIFMGISNFALIYDIPSSSWIRPSQRQMGDLLQLLEESQEDLRAQPDEIMANFGIKDLASTRLQHPWINELIELHFTGAQKRVAHSVNNTVLIGLNENIVLAIPPCSFGDEPFMTDRMLTCEACATEQDGSANCRNPMHTYDLLQLPPADRQLTHNQLSSTVTQAIAGQRLDQIQVNERLLEENGGPQVLLLGDRKSGSIDNQTAWKLTQATYAGGTPPSGWSLLQTCLGTQHQTRHADVYYHVGNGTLVVAFEGTSGMSQFQDWKDNLNRNETNVNDKTLHSRFYSYANDLYNCIKGVLDEHGTNGQADYVVGHSLGGASASAFRDIFVSKNGKEPSTQGTITFGGVKLREGGSCGNPGRRFANTYDPIAGNALGILTNKNHDIENHSKVWAEEDCGIFSCSYDNRVSHYYNGSGCNNVYNDHNSNELSWKMWVNTWRGGQFIYYFLTQHSNYGEFPLN